LETGLVLRILILGGTTEASNLARLLAGDRRFDPILSLAGRTATPASQPLPTRVGGFGGAEGLMRWLDEHAIAAVLDVTHPYAARISANAVLACRRLGLPLGSVVRPPWTEQPGDEWRSVASAEGAASVLEDMRQPQHVFLSLGRTELGAFATAPQHDYLGRTIEAAEDAVLPARIRFLRQRGPFDRAAEAKLLTAEKIDIIVSKNSGGAATYGKIDAAREAGLPVIMIRRPDKPQGEPLGSPQEAIAWLKRIAGHRCPILSPRGV
jgi:precorrin-6A/cobalt-precorrin-6A reductase